MDKVKDGVYLIYVKDGMMYPVGMSEDEWKMLQFLANTISSPLQVLHDPMGEAINLSKYKKK